MGIEFRTIQQFGIPEEHLREPIDGAILEAFGIDPDTKRELALSPVLIEGQTPNRGTLWVATATSARPEDERIVYGIVEIVNGRPLSPLGALDAASNWVRHRSRFVHGAVLPTQPIEKKSNAMSGIMLVCARPFSNKTAPNYEA